MPTRPSQFPAPFAASNHVDRPQDTDMRIDVGVAIVGGGPAGLACAIRLGQILEAEPALAEGLGEVPIAVLEKGKSLGSHSLSGAIVHPAVLGELLPGEDPVAALGAHGVVQKESVFLLPGATRAIRLPTPPPFHNKGNLVFSLSQLVRKLGDRAEALGAYILPETDAQTLLVEDGGVRGVRAGAKGLDRDGKPKAGAAPPTEIVARATVLAEGTQGHLRGVAIEQFDLHERFPQVYALGVKEVWKVARPLDRIVHTLGWPLRGPARYKEFGGSFIYPMGPEHVCVGMVVGLDYHDATLSVHDLLQKLKTHPLVADLLEGGERVQWGAKTIPEGGINAWPRRLAVPGAVICGDSAGFVNVPKLKGVQYALRSGMLAAEAIAACLRDGGDPGAPGALDSYDAAVRDSVIAKDLRRVRNMRQTFTRGIVVGGAVSGLMDATRGVFPGGDWETHPDADQEVEDLGSRYPQPDGKLTFDKLSSVYLSGNKTRDDQPNHIRLTPRRVPLELARMWVNLCPAAVYEIEEGSESPDGTVRVRVNASNCVQCGAITAKGGRLTPAEGGSGPEYTLM